MHPKHCGCLQSIPNSKQADLFIWGKKFRAQTLEPLRTSVKLFDQVIIDVGRVN